MGRSGFENTCDLVLDLGENGREEAYLFGVMKDLFELDVRKLVSLLKNAILRTILLNCIVGQVNVPAVNIGEAELLARRPQIAFFKEVAPKQTCLRMGHQQSEYSDVKFTTVN